MESLSHMFESVWDHTGRRLLVQRERKKQIKHRNAYWDYNHSPLKIPLRSRSRALPIDKEECPGDTSHPRPKGKLLSLPPEIRLLVWEHAFGGRCIAIYRDHNRLTHCLVDETNSRLSDVDIPVSIPSIKSAIRKLPKSPHRHDKRPHLPHKTSALALLQSCRIIYSEGITLLYTNNTFLFLQNNSLRDFYQSILPERFAALRSVHIHAQIRDSPRMWEWAWRAEAFSIPLTLRMPNLDHLSVFIQGPMQTVATYRLVLNHVDDIYSRLERTPRSFVLRLPYQWTFVETSHGASRAIETLINDTSRKFPIVRPSCVSSADNADQDTGADFGWRQGVVYFPPNDTSSDFVLQSYTVWTPTPPGTSWPCII